MNLNKKKMILHIIVPDFFPNETGFAIAFKNFCFSIVEREDIYRIKVYTHINSNDFLHEKIEIINDKKIVKSSFFIRKFPNKLGLLISKLYLTSFFRRLKSNILNGYDNMFFVESLYLVHISSMLEEKFPKVPVVTRIHGSLPEVAFWNKDSYRSFVMDITHKCKNIGVTTYHYINYLNNNFKPNINNNRKYFILPNTLPFSNFENKLDVNSKFRMLQLGRMGEFGYFQKGFQDVIQALFYLESNFPIDFLKSLEYIVIGNGPYLEEYLTKLNKLKYINFKHYKSLPNDKVQNQIDLSSVILIPSRFEGMSMFATEVLSKGKPFIFTSDGGMMDMMEDGYNGFDVRPFDYIGIAEAIIKLKTNPSLIEEFSKKSVEIFNKKFSYPIVNNHFSVLIKELL